MLAAQNGMFQNLFWLPEDKISNQICAYVNKFMY